MSTKDKLIERFKKMHRPHPQNIVGYKTLKEIQALLKKEKIWEN